MFKRFAVCYILFLLITFSIFLIYCNSLFVSRVYTSWSQNVIWCFSAEKDSWKVTYPTLMKLGNTSIIVTCAFNEEYNTVLFFNALTGNIISNVTISVNLTRAIPPFFSTGDFNHDGIDDIILHGSNGKIYIIDGRNHSIIWVSNLIGIPHAPPIFADFDCDGFMDILCKTNDAIHIISPHKSTHLTFKINNVCIPNIADVDNDGVPEIFLVGKNGSIICLNSSLEIKWSVSINLTSVYGWASLYTEISVNFIKIQNSTFIIAPVANHLLLLDSNGNVIFDTTLDNQGCISHTPLVCDLNMDGKLEFLCCVLREDLSEIFTIDINGEQKLLFSTNSLALLPCSTPWIIDMDNDGNYELIILNYGEGITLIDFNDKVVAVLKIHEPMRLWNALIADDINNDSKYEILFTIKKKLYVIVFPETYHFNFIERILYFHKMLEFLLKIFISLGLIIGLVFMFISLKKSIKTHRRCQNV